MERHYGSQCQPGEFLPAAEIAKRIRVELKGLELGVKFSVRSSQFSGGRAIDVTIKGYEGPVSCPECHGYRSSRYYAGLHGDLCQTCATWGGWMAPEARVLHDAVESVREAFNYDGSDPMTDYYDVNYYGSTTFENQ